VRTSLIKVGNNVFVVSSPNSLIKIVAGTAHLVTPGSTRATPLHAGCVATHLGDFLERISGA
jgi:hypothetical protein